nr:hypothetical protein BaRGS_019146 [Batillaria attramentaria]
MVALVGSTKLLGKDHFCCVCDDVAATSVCFDCHDMLCQSCVKVHGKLSGTRMHTVETLASLTPQRLAASRPALCPSHEDERARLFCPTHEASICLLCATSDHRACQEVTKLETKLEEAAKVLNELVSVLSEGETRLEVAMVELDQHAAQIDKNTEKAAQDIDAACDRLQKSVEACRRRLKELAQSAKTDAIFAVNVAKGILQKRRGNLTSHKQLVGRVQQTTPSSCFIEMATRLRDRVNGIDCSVYLPSSARTITNPMLVIEEMPLMQVERMLAHLGELKVTAAAVSAQPIDPDLSDPRHKTFWEDTRHTVVKNKRRSGKVHFKY